MPINARALVMALLANGTSKADIAKEIGYDRTSVSRWINEPDYNGARIAAAVLVRYSRIICPHLRSEISPADCSSYALRRCPTSNAREVRHWKACQTCVNKPSEETK